MENNLNNAESVTIKMNKVYNEAELISIEELCEILSIGRNSAYTLLNENKIKAFRIGRVWKIPRGAVDDFILTQSKLK